jgi:predicted RNase H-like HicB family nuclease
MPNSLRPCQTQGSSAYFSSMKYSVTLIESPEGWAISCPALPGCHSQGATRAEALENIKEAIQLWLEVAEEDAAHAEEESGVTVSRELVTV